MFDWISCTVKCTAPVVRPINHNIPGRDLRVETIQKTILISTVTDKSICARSYLLCKRSWDADSNFLCLSIFSPPNAGWVWDKTALPHWNMLYPSAAASLFEVWETVFTKTIVYNKINLRTPSADRALFDTSLLSHVQSLAKRPLKMWTVDWHTFNIVMCQPRLDK